MADPDHKASERLVGCINELQHQNRSDLTRICETMKKSYDISPEKTQLLLEQLIKDARIFNIEKEGTAVYMIVQSPNQLKLLPKPSMPDIKQIVSQPNKEIQPPKDFSCMLGKCIKEINQKNNKQGASFDDIADWLKHHNFQIELSELQRTLSQEVECMRIRQTEAGLYLLVKKRGRPQSNGSPSSRRVVKTLGVPSVPAKRSPDTENPKKVAQLGKRKRFKKSHDDFEFYDTPGNKGAPVLPPVTDLICDFCLQSSSSNKFGKFEELLMCKDCPAKAHASCMGYGEILSRRARMGPWQCIDCKTCCLCLDSGHPDDLLFCDACDKGYHMFCHDPAIKEKPKNKWACNACIGDGVTTDDLISDADIGENHSPISSKEAASIETANTIAPQSNVSVGPVHSTPSAPAAPSQNSVSPKHLLPAKPSHWSIANVSQYIIECGFPDEAAKFSDQEIDGKSLMLLLRQDVLCNMQLKLGPALKIYEKIRMIQKGPANQ